MAQRWLLENWHPVNELGYRDVSLHSKNINSARVFFLGDSFTAGHGVTFEDTYYWKTVTRMLSVIEGYNISMNGFSTRDQRAEFVYFTSTAQVYPDVVVHQYFGNDIQDYISPLEIGTTGSLEAWLRKSELVDFVLGGLESREQGLEYTERLVDAYNNEDVFSRHKNDLTLLHDYVRSYGAKVVFVLFPSLYGSSASHLLNGAYVDKVRSHFLATCSPGDALLDVSDILLSVPLDKQVVNFMDPHPSPELHALVAKALAGLLLPMIYGGAQESSYAAGVYWCG